MDARTYIKMAKVDEVIEALADEARLRSMSAEELAEEKHLSPLATLFLLDELDKKR